MVSLPNAFILLPQAALQGCKEHASPECLVLYSRLLFSAISVVKHQILPPVIRDLGQFLLQPRPNLLIQQAHILNHLADDKGSVHTFIQSILEVVSIHQVSFHKSLFHSGLLFFLSIFQ